MTQLSLFPSHEITIQSTSINGFSIESISTLDELQIQELEMALTITIDYWLGNLYDHGIDENNLNPFDTALLDISINWLREMLNIINKIDPTFILIESYNREEVLFLKDVAKIIE